MDQRQSTTTEAWAGPLRREIREHMLWVRFDAVLRRASEGTARAAADGDDGTWPGRGAHGAARPGAAALHRAVELCRGILSWPGVPPVPTAAIRGMHGLALTALGRHGDAAPEIVAARAVAPAEPFQVYTGGVELTTGMSLLRAAPPVDAATLHVTAERLIAVARRCGDVRAEADVWRHWAPAAGRLGEDLRASVAQERFDAIADRLDWRARLDGASLLTLRSTILTRIARGGSWTAEEGADQGCG